MENEKKNETLQNALTGTIWERLGSGYNPKPGDMERMRAEGYNKTDGDRNIEDGFNCPICKNKGVIAKVVEENGQFRVVYGDCKCVKTRTSIMRMKRSGLEELIKKYTLDKYEVTEPWQKKVKDSAIDYVKNAEKWFFFGGQSGVGKTMICTAICREFLLRGELVYYMLWRDEITKLKAAVTESAEYQELIRKYKTCDVLYIDDLFKTGKAGTEQQKPTAADINIAFEILNHRYNNKLITIISSECTITELMDIDEAVAGRIAENSVVLSIGRDRKKNYRMRNVFEI